MPRQLRTDVSRAFDALGYDAECYDGIAEGAGQGKQARFGPGPWEYVERRKPQPMQVPVAAAGGRSFSQAQGAAVPNAPSRGWP